MNASTAFAFLSLVFCCSSVSLGVPRYSIEPLGFNDLEHTRDDGYTASLIQEINAAGQVSGISNRYNGGSSYLGDSAWLYDGASTINIGLTGGEHTNNDGFKASFTQQMNEAGQVRGYSNRYLGGSFYAGSSAWVYDGATTVEVGLTGAGHVRSDGYRASASAQMNEAGQASGFSQRYNGGTFLGRSAWVYDGATTIDVSLTSSGHTRNDGFRDSTAYGINAAGQVHGTAERYQGGGPFGRSAWFYNGTTTLDIGLADAAHIGGGGYRYSEGPNLNDAGQVTGYSLRFNGAGPAVGSSAWLYDGTTTINIGLTGAEHTRNDGAKNSSPGAGQLNAAGHATGVSIRYNGGNTALGRSAWLYDGATTIDVGLTGAEHTRNDGYKDSLVFDLNEAGQVQGISERYSGGGVKLGQSVWLHDSDATIDIGLTGAEYTSDDGSKWSDAGQLNEAGQVTGTSNRFNGSAYWGRSAWLYDGGATIDIGLVDAEHTRNDGYRFSSADGLNQAGQVFGSSARYNGGSTDLGQDSWLYDPMLDQTFELQLSMRSDGFASSSVNYLSADGLVLGAYTLFDALDNDLGQRAFYFTIADGAHDLGSLVDGGLSANGWNILAGAFRANGMGQLLGYGKLAGASGSGDMAYLLTPVVPEPSALTLGMAACVGLLAARRAPGKTV